MDRDVLALARRAETRPRAAYAFEIAKWPSILGVLIVGVSTGLVISGAMLAIPFALAVASATWIVSGNPRMQRHLDAEAHLQALRTRRDDRETKLEEAHVARSGLNEATLLVDGIVSAAPGSATRYELESLLDYYVEVAIARARCVAITHAADRSELEAPRFSSAPRQALLERRRALHSRCRARALELELELEALIDLLHILAEREAGVSRAPDVDAVVDGRLAQLDAGG